MKQTKIESGIEIFCNYASGFLIAWLTYAHLILKIEWLQHSAFSVTLFLPGSVLSEVTFGVDFSMLKCIKWHMHL